MGLFGNELNDYFSLQEIEMDIFVTPELYNKLISMQALTESGIILENGGAVNLSLKISKNKTAKLFIRSRDGGGASDKSINHGPSFKVKSINGIDVQEGNKWGVEISFNNNPQMCAPYIPQKGYTDSLKKAHRIINKNSEILDFGLKNCNLLMQIWNCKNEDEFGELIKTMIKNNRDLS